MKCNAEARAIIKMFEGLRLDAYRCPAGKWTIGYGHTGDVKPGMRITQHQAEVVFDLDVEHAEDIVSRLCPGGNVNQFSALVSFAFNVGERRLATSTLRKKFLRGDFQGAADQLPRWIHVRGEPWPGLISRRDAERALFLSPVEPTS